MSSWSVTIPGQPPSVNELRSHIVGKNYRPAWSDAFYAYRNEVCTLVQIAKPRDWRPPEYRPKLGEGMLVIEIALELDRDMDADNILKPLLDGVKYGLGTMVVYARKSGNPRVAPIYDDSGFLPRFLSKKTGVKKPQVHLTIVSES